MWENVELDNVFFFFGFLNRKFGFFCWMGLFLWLWLMVVNNFDFGLLIVFFDNEDNVVIGNVFRDLFVK